MQCDGHISQSASWRKIPSGFSTSESETPACARRADHSFTYPRPLRQTQSVGKLETFLVYLLLAHVSADGSRYCISAITIRSILKPASASSIPACNSAIAAIEPLHTLPCTVR